MLLLHDAIRDGSTCTRGATAGTDTCASTQYSLLMSYLPNGNVDYATDANGSWSFGAGAYDDFNRLVSAQTVQGPNAVANPDMESSPTGWDIGTVVADTTRAHSGTRYLQLTTSTSITASNSVIFSATSGQTVAFGGWVYRESGNGLVELKLRGRDSTGAGVWFPNPTITSPPTGVWTYEEGTALVPSNVVSVQLVAVISGATMSSQARFDDVFLNAAAQSTYAQYTYAYDRFGNRWDHKKNGTQVSWSPALTFTNQNRISGAPAGCTNTTAWCYDAAGNLLNDGVNKYTYDAENRIISAQPIGGGTVTNYIYDADGRRVQSKVGTVTTDYVYDVQGHRVGDIGQSNTFIRGEIYAGGQHIASYEAGSTYFAHADWLGTERVRTNVAGGWCRTNTSLPFGDNLVSTGACYGSPQFFTGKERDSETD